MTLSVIVLTHNRERALRRCLDRLFTTLRRPEGTDDPPPAELIVVNNGSTDGTAAWLDALSRNGLDPALVVVHRPENEFVCARNHAIDRARGRFIAQVDDDVLVAPGWYRTLLEPMERDATVGATGQDGFYQNYRWEDTRSSSGLLEGRQRPEPGEACDLLTGYCWAWRNERTDTGARFRYDERFNPFWLEDSDLQMQIRHAGLRIVRTWPAAVHDSLHDWTATNNNRGPTAWRHAAEHLALLRAKWAHVDGMTYEGKRVGL
jgi:glycosyltransferase involved in cell wall biosynthesis